MIYLNVPGILPDFIERKYFDLDECLKNAELEGFGVFSEQWHAVASADPTEEPGLTTFIERARLAVPPLFRQSGVSWPLPIGRGDTPRNREIFKEFFFGRLWPTFSTAFIGSIECRKGQTESEQALLVYTEFWKNELAPLLINTWRKYSYLVALYEDNLDNLMDRVKSESATRSNFNDTPQETAPADLWDDPTHETTLTKTKQETESDFNTPMERIDEIRRKIEDVYSAWVYEFDKIFVREPME